MDAGGRIARALVACACFCAGAAAGQPAIVFIDVESDPGAHRYQNFRKALQAKSEPLAQRLRYEGLPAGTGSPERRERLRAVERQAPAVLVTLSTDLASDARAMGLTIPMVFATLADPIDLGFVDEANRNLHDATGVSLRGEPMAKQIELLREWVGPKRRLGVVADRFWIASGRGKRALALVESATGAKPVVRMADNAVELDRMLEGLRPDTADAWLVVSVPAALRGARKVVARMEAIGRPAVYSSVLFSDAGGVLSYEAFNSGIHDRIAALVIQVARGVRARDIPFEKPTDYRLAVSVAGAERSAFPVPKSLLRRANAFR